MKKLILTIIIIFSISSCATGPKFTNYISNDASCIEGDLANVFSFFASGEANVGILEIDGLIAGGPGSFCVSPGKHQLGLHANNNNQIAQDYIDIDFPPGKKYELKANLRGISFHFQLHDITNGEDKIIAEFKMKVGSTNQTPIVPVYIPSK